MQVLNAVLGVLLYLAIAYAVVLLWRWAEKGHALDEDVARADAGEPLHFY